MDSVLDNVTKKVSFSLPQKDINTLKNLASNRGTSMAEVLRRAIAMEEFLASSIAAGGKILIENKDKKVQQLVRL